MAVVTKRLVGALVASTLALLPTAAGAALPAGPAVTPQPVPQHSTDRTAHPDCTVTSSWARPGSALGQGVVTIHAAVQCAAAQDYLSVRVVVTDLMSSDADLPATTPAAGGDNGSAIAAVSDVVSFPSSLPGHVYVIDVSTLISPAAGVPMTIGGQAPDCAVQPLTISCGVSYRFVGGNAVPTATSPVRDAPAYSGATLTSSAAMACPVTLVASAPSAPTLTATGSAGSASCHVAQSFGIVEIYADPERRSDLVLGSGQNGTPGESRATLRPAPAKVPVVAVYYLELDLTDGSYWTQLPAWCGSGFHRTSAFCQIAITVRHPA